MINYLAVVVAAVIAMIIGSAWYSPVIFGKEWMRLRGVDPGSMHGMPMPKKEMAVEFLCSLLTAFVVAIFAGALGAVTLAGALLLGFWLWLGLYVPALLGPVLWEKRPFNLFLINAGQRLVTVLIIAIIVGMWQ